MSGARRNRDNRQGAASRRRLVKVAEALFAQHGIDGVSIRSVNAAAGVGAAAIHYHFGSKEKLIAAVVAERGEGVASRVSELALGLSAQPEPPSSRQLVELIAIPYRELIERARSGGLCWLKIVAQLAVSHPDLLERLHPEAQARVLEQVRRSFADIDPERLTLRWAVASRTLTQMMSHADRWVPYRTDLGAAAFDRYVGELIDFVAGGLDAAREKPPGDILARAA
jgi:AcrR family transcriptional regulator